MDDDPRTLGERVLFGMWPVPLAIALALITALLFPRIVHAHDKWADGSPVPAWVKQYCCGPSDIHHYRYDEVKITAKGFVLPDYPKVIPADDKLHVFKSEDGDYWAFFATYADGTKSDVYCLFAPPGSI